MDQKIFKILTNLQEDLQEIKGTMATKDDVVTLKVDIEELKDDVVTLKYELKQTKEELMKEIIKTDTGVTLSTDKNKANQSDLIALEDRVKKIENHLNY